MIKTENFVQKIYLNEINNEINNEIKKTKLKNSRKLSSEFSHGLISHVGKIGLLLVGRLESNTQECQFKKGWYESV